MSKKLGALVMTLGFEPGPLVSAIAAHASRGFEPGAEVIVLTPSFEDERAERAWRQLQDIFGMMKLEDFGVKLHKITIELEEFSSAVLQVKELFSKLMNKVMSISLTGGMRALVLAVFVAYLLTDWSYVPDVEVFLEGRSMALRVPKLAAALGPRVNKRRLRVLEVMRLNTIYNIDDLCGFLSKDRSTTYRYLKELAGIGLVEKIDSGFKITDLGLMLKKAME